MSTGPVTVIAAGSPRSKCGLLALELTILPKTILKIVFCTLTGLFCFKLTIMRNYSFLKSAAARLHHSKTCIFQRSLKCSLLSSRGARQKSSHYRRFEANHDVFLAKQMRGISVSHLRKAKMTSRSGHLRSVGQATGAAGAAGATWDSREGCLHGKGRLKCHNAEMHKAGSKTNRRRLLVSKIR